MSFDLDKFTAEPSVELLNLGKKTDLLNLAKHYKLYEIKSSMCKHEITNILVQYFVDEEIFNENALSLIVDVEKGKEKRERRKGKEKRERKKGKEKRERRRENFN